MTAISDNPTDRRLGASLSEAVNRLRAFIREKNPDGCRVSSLGASCHCPLCDVDSLVWTLIAERDDYAKDHQAALDLSREKSETIDALKAELEAARVTRLSPEAQEELIRLLSEPGVETKAMIAAKEKANELFGPHNA